MANRRRGLRNRQLAQGHAVLVTGIIRDNYADSGLTFACEKMDECLRLIEKS